MITIRCGGMLSLLGRLAAIGGIVVAGWSSAIAPSAGEGDGPVLTTRWTRDVSPANALPDYPRPQLVRKAWQSLNGLWDYALTPRNAGVPNSFQGTILVPYPVESVLSRVTKRVDEGSRLWYHRLFNVPVGWHGQRLLMHFGAVDWETVVMVNGKSFPVHRGGYDGFTLDITDALTPSGSQDLIVAVWGPTEAGQPHGKQARHPEGIFYTPTTGIWQTVWIEPVPITHIDGLRLEPDVDRSRLQIAAILTPGRLTSDCRVEAVVLAEGRTVARAVGGSDGRILLLLPQARLWWPDTPFLYDLRVTLTHKGKPIDVVTSYFGMRKISIGLDPKGVTRILLNNRFVLHNGLLDQGFWPDGLYTAPTDTALRYDIEMTKTLGFNMCRKHLKVEPDRWYYWADRLGLLVWQDMPCAMALSRKNDPTTIPDMAVEYEHELRRMIAGRFNHPCIVMWILFNEGMGLEMSPTGRETPSDLTKALQRQMVEAARQEEDPTRLIDAESGAGGAEWQGKNPWDIGLGDIVDYHCYGKPTAPVPEAKRASVIGEYGFAVAALDSVHTELGQVVSPGASGLVLTQLTDVENEHNGVLRYDRTLKDTLSAEQIGARMRAQLNRHDR